MHAENIQALFVVIHDPEPSGRGGDRRCPVSDRLRSRLGIR
jgi:hypothetical protein